MLIIINKSTKKNIFIREVLTIYTFNEKTVLTCKNNFKEIFRNMFVIINNVKFLEYRFLLMKMNLIEKE